MKEYSHRFGLRNKNPILCLLQHWEIKFELRVYRVKHLSGNVTESSVWWQSSTYKYHNKCWIPLAESHWRDRVFTVCKRHSKETRGCCIANPPSVIISLRQPLQPFECHHRLMVMFGSDNGEKWVSHRGTQHYHPTHIQKASKQTTQTKKRILTKLRKS